MIWGNTSKGLPWSSIQAGSQTTYAHTRANYATGMDLKKKLTGVAAKTRAVPRRLRHRTAGRDPQRRRPGDVVGAGR